MVDNAAFDEWFDRLLEIDDVSREAALHDLQLTDPHLVLQLRRRFSALERSTGWLEPWGVAELRAGERFAQANGSVLGAWFVRLALEEWARYGRS